MSARSYEQGHFNAIVVCGYADTHSILRIFEIRLLVPRGRFQTQCLIVQERHGLGKPKESLIVNVFR